MVEKFIPNIITIIRLLAIPPAIYFIWLDQYSIALVIFAFAGISDAADGFLARRYHWESRWGAAMDPIADKSLLVSTAAILAYKELLPLWLFVLMMLRDFILISGSTLYRARFGPFDVKPSALGKLSTFVQITLIVSILIHAAHDLINSGVVNVLIATCGLTTLVSGIHYIWVWLRKAIHEQNDTIRD